MSLREPIGNLMAGFDIPFWNIVFLPDLIKLFLLLFISRLSIKAFSSEFPDSESVSVFDTPLIMKLVPDIVTAADTILQGKVLLRNQILCVSGKDVRTMA